VFGEQRRLQPMADDQKARWTKEIDWLLSVADHIVEFVPSQQVSENGTCMEVRLPFSVPIVVLFSFTVTISIIQWYILPLLKLHYLELNYLLVKQIMVTQQRQDLQMNIPALRKLDAMLLVSMGLLILIFYLTNQKDI
jgi:hypothetical protein